MKTPISFCLAAIFGSQVLFASDKNDLTPVMVEPGDVFLENDFEEAFKVEKSHPIFRLGQGTNWEAKDGFLVGTQSSPDYQAKKKAAGNGHLGTAPRLQFAGSPKDVILKYSFKISGGKFTKLLPMVEAGHHLRRVYFGPEGSQILVDHEQTTVTESDFVLELETWYHLMIEIKDNEFLVRFQDGPTLYGNDPGVGADFANYNIGITATDQGTMFIDNMTIWEAGVLRKDWSETKGTLAK